MKILNKEILDCTFEWEPNTVLSLDFTHRWRKGSIKVKDYEDTHYWIILKQLRKKVREAFEEWKLTEKA